MIGDENCHQQSKKRNKKRSTHTTTTTTTSTTTSYTQQKMAQPEKMSAQEYEILQQFQKLTEEQNSIANKIAELETDKREHEYVSS